MTQEPSSGHVIEDQLHDIECIARTIAASGDAAVSETVEADLDKLLRRWQRHGLERLAGVMRMQQRQHDQP